jgi:hypothetical protein
MKHNVNLYMKDCFLRNQKWVFASEPPSFSLQQGHASA